ncbi:MAG: hypothetical protein ACOYL8_01260 [Patescibacteria group bacterium]
MIRTEIDFTEISTACGENSQTWADANLIIDGDCKINSGSDLVIWTKHFTSFATYTQTATVTSGGGGGGGGGPATTYCSDITYSPWQTCVGNQQFRKVLTSTPASCTLTTIQQIASSRICELATSTEQILKEATSTESILEIKNLGNIINSKTSSVILDEKKLTIKIDKNLVKRLAGRILLQTERFGQAWYLDAVSLQRYYLADGPTAYEALRKFGLGINNVNLAKIPVAPKSAIPSDYVKSSNYSTALANKLKGRIVLQVENHGEAWYINPTDGYRYYLASGEAAYQIMRQLSLGISNENIRKIGVGDLE